MERRICTKCGVEKDIIEYSLHKPNKDGIHKWCKNCVKNHAKEYHENNKTIIKEKHKKYYQENKKSINECSKKWKELNQTKIKEYRKKYRKENPSICNMYKQKYKAKSKQLPSTLTVTQWNYAKEYFDNKCAYCGKIKPLQQEHFIALSNGGGYTQDNIIPSCGGCNSSKNDRTFKFWYIRQSFYSKEREDKILKYLSL
jgi:hypothetical protein